DLRAVLPGFRARLSRLRDQVELPDLLAGVDVETPHEARNVVQANRKVAVHRRIADDDDVADDDRRRARCDLSVRRIDTDRSVGAGLRDWVPLLTRLGLSRRECLADLERTGVVDGERYERIPESVLEVDDAVLAECRVGLAGLGVERGQ